jgi:dTDP-4-amino-4,6-dideoxygalactose transaminase
VIRCADRDALRAHLDRCRVGTEIYYPVPLHRQECFASSARALECPHAEASAATSLALPIYGELTLEQQAYVVSSIAAFFRERPS